MSRQCSIFISRLLNDLGYSNEMVKFRQKFYATELADSVIRCGSKREGLTLPFENDFDQMAVHSTIECRDVFDGNSKNNGLIKFQLVTFHNTAPGYTFLKCISLNNGELSEFIRECLVEVEYGTYLMSSDSWKHGHKEILHRQLFSPGNDEIIIPNRNNQGPSSPCLNTDWLINIDTVDAIPCHCPQLISYWRNRIRLYDWPSSELIDTVSSLEAHVVPIGYKDSPLHFLEWRICFTKAEIRLIQSLNDCQTKLIILLKMIAKHELKPVCKEMSTYVMKNLVLWMAEKYPSETFEEGRLLVLLKHSLKLLKSCIMDKKLPSYMIEERNLFADRITDEQGVELCKKIETLLHEGARLVLRCPKILEGLNFFLISPDHFYLSSEKRWYVESLFLHLQHSFQQYSKHLITKDPCITIHDLIDSACTQDYIRQSLAPFPDLGEILFPDLLDGMGWDENFDNVL